MQAATLVREEADRHEVEELERVPDMEPLWAPTDEVAADEDIVDTEYEGELLAQCHSLCVVPLLPKLVYARLHPLAVFLKLFIGGGYAPPPFFHNLVFGKVASRSKRISLPDNFFRLRADVLLELLEL